MQFQKEDIRKNILSAARSEFLENSFEKASIRNITSAAQTSKSNVYNYFHDKDALFAAVVEPTTSGIKTGFEKLRYENQVNMTGDYTIEAQKRAIGLVMGFVFAHQEDLRLLLFHSAGSSLSDFKNRVMKMLADVLSEWVSCIAPQRELSNFFIQMVAGFYLSAIEHILADEMSFSEASGHLDEFLHFVYGGWKSVL